MSNLGDTLNSYKYWIVAALGLVFLAQSIGRNDKSNISPSTDATFQNEVAKESRPVLVKFGATWCGPCQMMDKSLDSYEKLADGKVKVLNIDVDTNQALSSHYGVRSIPHSFVFYQGKVLANQVGYMDANEIESWVRKSTKNL